MTEHQTQLTAQLPALLLPWFRENARVLPWRRDREPYHVWLSEIMLQQTRVEAVKPYYLRFLSELPTIYALSKCADDRLMKLWEGLGYYSRARNLAKAAKYIMNELGGVFPRDFKSIRALSGIGDYTAGAIASICFDLPEPAVDGNVLRVVTRICADDSCTDEQSVKNRIRDALRSVYVQTPQRGDLTQALMELGAVICVPNGSPHCDICPCREICTAHAENTVDQFPVRKPKKSRRIEYHTVFTLQCGDEIATAKRPSRGLLAGLWELPHLDGKLSPQDALKAASESWHCKPNELISVTNRVHIFTHIEWHMTCVYLQCTEKSEQFTWVSKETLAEETALPTAFRICLPDFSNTSEHKISDRKKGKNMRWFIRPAVAADIDALVEMRIAQLREEHADATCDIRDALYAYFQELLTTGSQSYLVAEDADAVVGAAGISFFNKAPYYKNPTGKIAVVSSVFVVPEYRRLGIATALMQRQLRRAREYGCGELYVVASDAGIPLYESLGFTPNDHFRRIEL